ncbi:hypothetical protein [Bacillus sp. FJAT-18017]|nr:hypothetical protein [Bacillus sp. FJAT-18017]
MSILREKVEAKRNHYFKLLKKSGLIQHGTENEYTLTEVLEVYKKWKGRR